MYSTLTRGLELNLLSSSLGMMNPQAMMGAGNPQAMMGAGNPQYDPYQYYGLDKRANSANRGGYVEPDGQGLSPGEWRGCGSVMAFGQGF